MACESRSTQNVDDFDDFVANFTTQLVYCNFDKARDLWKREKILNNNGPIKEILNTLIISEKNYSELAFLSSRNKVTPKKDNYDDLQLQCDKLISSNYPDHEGIIMEIIQYARIRCRLIDFYTNLFVFAGCNKHLKFEDQLAALESIVKDCFDIFVPKTLTNVKTTIELEIGCLCDLLSVQLYLENWNLLLCSSHLNSLKTKMLVWEKTLHNKETWKMNIFRSNNFPELYRWMLKFKIFVMEKFSLYFYVILRQQTSVGDLKALCNKYHLEFAQKFQTLSKKFGHEATNVMLIFDACGMKNWRGPGYYCPLRKNIAESTNSSYYIMLRYPEKLNEACSLMPTIKKILVDHFSDILFLDRVICRYISSENSTYFVTSIEKKISLVSYYNCKKDDRKLDVESYMLELACMIRCHRIFLALNK